MSRALRAGPIDSGPGPGTMGAGPGVSAGSGPPVHLRYAGPESPPGRLAGPRRLAPIPQPPRTPAVAGSESRRDSACRQ